MKIVYWNCRGAGFDDFRGALIDLIQSTNPSLLILSESRVHSSCLHRLFQNHEFDKIICSEARGFANGLWVLWNSSEVTLYPVVIDFQIITFFVLKQGRIDWVLSTIYASPQTDLRNAVWSFIQDMATCISLSWLLLGI